MDFLFPSFFQPATPPPPTVGEVLWKWFFRFFVGSAVLVVLLILSWFWLKRYIMSRVNNAIRPEYRDLVFRLREWFQIEHNSGTPVQPQADNPETTSFTSAETGCPICLSDPAVLPVQTNCGHKFCGNCMIAYWRRGNWGLGETPNCPVCRQRITLLMRNVNEGSTMPEDLDQVPLIEREIHEYNRRFSGGPRSLAEKIRDIPGLLGHMFTNASIVQIIRLFSQGRMIFYLLAFLAYFIFPFDLLPESVLGLFGLADDLLALTLLLSQLAAFYRAIIARGDDHED